MAKGAEEIETRVIQMLADHLSIDAVGIEPESQLVRDLGMDSLLAVEFAFNLEEEFCIQIPEDDLGHVKSVADIVKVISKQLGVDRDDKSR